jgi:hypothetical protein
LRLLYAFNCEHAEARADGRLDVHGVFHELYAPGFPAAHQMVFVIGLEWNVEPPERRDFKIDLLDPSGSPSFTIQGHTEITERRPGSPPPRTVLILPIDDVRFPTAGTHIFQLTVGDEVIPLAPLHLIEDPAVR